MRRIIIFVISTVSIFLSAFDYDAYKQVELDVLIEQNDAYYKTEEGSSVDIGIDSRMAKYSSLIIFTRKLREIDPKSKEYIQKWAMSLSLSQDVVDMFSHEFLVNIDGYALWVPVQEQLIPHMGEELEAGDSFTLYYIYAGYNFGQHVLLASEFKK